MAEELSPSEVVYGCRNPEAFGDGSPVRIRQSRIIKWFLKGQLPWMTKDALRAVITEAIGLWADVADVGGQEVFTEAEADCIITVVPMDGPGGVLADATPPHPGMRVQSLRLDVAESALRHKMVAIVCHEVGHLFGLLHFPSGPPPELMEPSLKDVETPQPTEAALMEKWYGPPKSQPAPKPVPAGVVKCTMFVEPGTDKVSCKIAVEQGDKKAELSGSKAW